MSDDTPESLIPYDEIVQDALRAVVGRVLGEIEQIGACRGVDLMIGRTVGLQEPHPDHG